MDAWDLLVQDWQDFFNVTRGRGGPPPYWKDVWEMWIRKIPTSELQDAMTCYYKQMLTRAVVWADWMKGTSYLHHLEGALVERLLLGGGE